MNKVVNDKCFIYARKAVKEQNQSDEEAVADQTEQLKKLAKERGLTITHAFIEVGSGSDGRRKELTKMLNMLKTGETKIILCTNIDRFSRDYNLIVQLDKLFKANKVVLVTPGFTYGMSSKSDFEWDTYVYFSKMYKQMLSDNTKRGIAQAKVKKGILLARVSSEKQLYEPNK